MMSPVLLTGATGFIGFHLAAELLRRGRSVHLIVRPESSRQRLDRLPGQSLVHVHDGTTEGLIRIVEEARPVTVFHLASFFRAEHAPEEVEPMIRSNVLFGTQLLEAMGSLPEARLVNTGTAWQHFHSYGYRPVCLYAATKQAFEDLLRFYVDARGVRAVTLKIYDSYGPDDPRGKLFTVLARKAQTGEELAMVGGEQKLDLVHVDDLVAAFLRAEEMLRKGEAGRGEDFAVGTFRPLTLKELAAKFEKVWERPLRIRWGARPYREREVFEPWPGPPLPGWSARIDIEEGIRRMRRADRE